MGLRGLWGNTDQPCASICAAYAACAQGPSQATLVVVPRFSGAFCVSLDTLLPIKPSLLIVFSAEHNERDVRLDARAANACAVVSGTL